MALTTEDLIDGVRQSRQFLYRHLEGLEAAQWEWKPYAECKSIRESLKHLIGNDRAALQMMESGGDFKMEDYDALMAEVDREAPTDLTALRVMAEAAHEALLTVIRSRYAESPLDTEVCIFGSTMPLGKGVPYLSAEDYYHAGQIAFIRLATDPTWNYYASIYG